MQNFYYYIVGLSFCSYFLSKSLNDRYNQGFIQMVASLTATIGMWSVYVFIIMAFWHAIWWHVVIVGLISCALPGFLSGWMSLALRTNGRLPILINLILYIGILQFGYMTVMNMFGKGF